MTQVSLLDLWLPIVAAWLAVHVLSTLAWTVLPHHKPEWKHLPLAGEINGALKARHTEAGQQYLLTRGEAHDTDPGKCNGMLILWDHKPNMGKNVLMTLGFFLLASVTIGYLATIGLSRESSTVDVFRFTATAGVLAHVFAGIPTLIWFRRKCVMDLLDGLAYSLTTGAAFALLWPSA